jgi:hypothetical protein
MRGPLKLPPTMGMTIRSLPLGTGPNENSLPRSAVMLYSKIIDGATGAFWAAMAGKNVVKSDRGEICMVLDVAM